MPHRTGPFVLVALLASSALADDVVFSDFSDTTGLQINGSAGVVNTSDGDVMRLTPSASGRAGSVFSDTLVNAMDFSTRFQFRITDPGGAVFDNNTESGADGLVFVVQPIDSSLGGAGQGIGYTGIGNSLGIEFDTWGNGSNNDPSQSHVGVNLNGSVNHNSGLPTADITGPELDDGDLWTAWIDYDGSTLEIRLSADGLRPTDALISYDLNLVSVLGQDTAYVGFTSATGAAWANHDIVNWSYTGFTPIPAPASAPMLVAGAMGLASRRRR